MDELRRATAMILAGGLGTRLRAAVADRPKVLASVHGRPFLYYLLRQLRDAGIGHGILCTGYKGQMVQQVFGPRFGRMVLEYSCERVPLGTGGALRTALCLCRSETILVSNGDSWCGCDLCAFAAEHFARGAAASMLLARVADISRYGRVECDDSGAVVEFTEKEGPRGAGREGWISAGVYLINRRLIGDISGGGPVSLERDVLPGWIGRGLYGVKTDGEFIDIGTQESYAAAQKMSFAEVAA